MFNKKNKISESKQDLSNYIDDYDLFNSLLFDKLRDPSIKRISYTITKYEYRPDLIAKEIYGDEKYMGLLIYTCGLNLEQYQVGVVLQVIPKSDLDRLVDSV